eukprot:gene20283-22269_t
MLNHSFANFSSNVACNLSSVLNQTINGTIQNCSSNGTNSQDQKNSTAIVFPELWKISLATRIILISIYALIFLIGVSGNAMVCYVIGRKKKKTGGDVFVMSLGISDLLASLFVPFLMIADLRSEENRWFLGSALCTILPSVSPMTLIASSWSLMLIAVDRFRIITKPLQPRLSTKFKIIGIIVVWLVALGITVPYAISQGVDKDQSICIDQGVLSKKARNIYVTCWIVTGWGIPFIVISILYSICVFELMSKKKSNSVTVKQRRDENKRVVKMFLIIVSLFFIFTTPYSLMYVTFNYLLTYKREAVDINAIMKWNYALFVLTTLNSCMNPIIYAKLHREINPFVKKLAGRVFNCDSNKRKDGSAYEVSEKTCSTQRSVTTSSTARSTTYTNQAFTEA